MPKNVSIKALAFSCHSSNPSGMFFHYSLNFQIEREQFLDKIKKLKNKSVPRNHYCAFTTMFMHLLRYSCANLSCLYKAAIFVMTVTGQLLQHKCNKSLMLAICSPKFCHESQWIKIVSAFSFDFLLWDLTFVFNWTKPDQTIHDNIYTC